MEIAATDLAGLTRSAVASHERMLASASRMTDEVLKTWLARCFPENAVDGGRGGRSSSSRG